MGGEWGHRLLLSLAAKLCKGRTLGPNLGLEVGTHGSQLTLPFSMLISDSDLILKPAFNTDYLRTLAIPLNLSKLSGFSLMEKLRRTLHFIWDFCKD